MSDVQKSSLEINEMLDELHKNTLLSVHLRKDFLLKILSKILPWRKFRLVRKKSDIAVISFLALRLTGNF